MARATVFNRDPAAQAHAFETQGFEYLHIVDLDGAFAGKPVNAARGRAHPGDDRDPGAARRRHPRHGDDRGLARQGRQPRHHRHRGGARSGAGASARRSNIPGRVAVGLDARDGKVAVEGWAETSELTALDLARRFEDAGVAAIIYTDIARDGMLKGLNLDATIALADAVSIPVIASGGLASIADVEAMLEPRAQQARRRHRRPRALRRPARCRRGAGADPRRAGGGLSMFKVRVIPCLDVKDGRVVKGVNSSTCATPAIRSRRRSPMTRPAPTNSPSSTSPRATRTATSSSTW